MQLSVTVRNARLESIESTIGTSPKLRLYTGAAPANCAAARSGTLLAELTLPGNWLADASGGTKVLAGTWSGTASNAGTAGHWAIMDAAGTTCHMQGTLSATGGGGEMQLDNPVIASGQSISVSTFTITGGNA
jgi:hypothetical protein